MKLNASVRTVIQFIDYTSNNDDNATRWWLHTNDSDDSDDDNDDGDDNDSADSVNHVWASSSSNSSKLLKSVSERYYHPLRAWSGQRNRIF